MQTHSSHSQPSDIKLAATLFALFASILLFDVFAKMSIQHLEELYFATEQTAISWPVLQFFLGCNELLVVAAYIVQFIALAILFHLDIFQAKSQRLAAAFLICTSITEAIHYLITAAANFENAILAGFFMDDETASPVIYDFVFSWSAIDFYTRFIYLANAIAWLIILTTPSFRLNNWVPRREQICRWICIPYFCITLWSYILDAIYIYNPLGLLHTRAFDLVAFFSHTELVFYWLATALLLAAAIFFFKLRASAEELAPPPPA